jgi:VWFA-related protein
LCAFVLSAVLKSLLAQDSPAKSPSTLLSVYARTVVEDVVVMDKNGRAVPNLRKQDFQIFENGKPQTVTFFEPNFAAKETAVALPAALPPDTFTNVPPAPPNDVTNVLLLDALNTRSTERMFAQVQMVKYLASLPPNMRIAVFTLDNERFHLIWGFNQDSSALRAAIAKFTAKRSHSAPPSSDAQQRAEQQELITSIGAWKQEANQARDDRLGESADALQHFLSHGPGIIYEYGNFFTTMSALEALAHYLAGIPGRKNLFWLAGTFPHQFKSGVYFDWYQRAREKLAEAEVSVYPIDANGVDVDTGGFQSGGAISASSARFENAEGWAEETGGKAYHENNINQEIADAADHGSLYYRLAYIPSDNKEEGRERKIEVKVSSGDYKLFYRQRYFELTRKEIAKSEAAPAKDPFLGLMGRGMPNVSEIPYHLNVVLAVTQPGAGTPRAGQNAELSGKLTRYSIGFRLLPGSLFLLPEADGSRRKSLQVLLMVFSQDGKPINWESNTITLLVKPEKWAAEQKAGIAFRLEIDAPPGDIYLRTGVYDSSSSKVGTLEIPLSAVTIAQK